MTHRAMPLVSQSSHITFLDGCLEQVVEYSVPGTYTYGNPESRGEYALMEKGKVRQPQQEWIYSCRPLTFSFLVFGSMRSRHCVWV